MEITIDRIKQIVHQYWGNDYEDAISDSNFDGMDYQCYNESTADGYEVYVLKATQDEMNISENVYYYDSDLASYLFEVLLEGQTVYIDQYLWDDIYMDDQYEEYWVDQLTNTDELDDMFEATDMTEEEFKHLKAEYHDEEEATEE
jgi:hypothetical protein